MLTRSFNLKYILVLIASVWALVFILAPTAKADDLNSQHDLCTGANLSIQETEAGCGKVKIKNADGKEVFVDEKDHTTLKAENRVTKLINDIINLVSILAAIVAVFMIIYGGFRILTSAGNPESNKAGRSAILYALGGLLIVAFAQVIVKFVINKVLN